MDDNASKRRAWPKRLISVIVALVACLVTLFAIGWLEQVVSLSEATTLAAALLGVAASVASALGAQREARHEDRGIEESRARVRTAERAFEAALRVTRPGVEPSRVDGPIPPPPEDAGARTLERLEALRRARQQGTEDLQVEPSADSTRLTLPALWAVTHTRLDLYHDIATGQARRSFRNAQAAMIIGFVLLVVFLAVALQASTTAGSVVAGGLGAVSAALSGFISRTFVKSQETAATHLRAYFDQPLEFSRYLAAERLIADAGLTYDDRAKVLTSLVQAMASPAGAVVEPTQAVDKSGQASGPSNDAQSAS